MIEPINATTYRLNLEEDEVEIGDISSPDFKPHAKLKRWGGECFLTVKPAGDIEEVEVEIEGDKVKSKYKVKQGEYELELESEFYTFPPDAQNELGAFELNIILAKKPPTNKLVFNIEVQGLVFYYQPPLTQEDIDEGCKQPENAVGSYAVYHATKRDYILGQTNYKAGKAFHVYRPRVEDAKGKWVWGELHIDADLGLMTIAIPQDFLDTAKYPIRHAAGETFGYTSVGVNYVTMTNDRIYGNLHTGAAGEGTSMSAWVQAEKNFKLGLYKDSDSTFVKGTAELTGGAGADWVSGNFTENPTLEAIDYILVLFAHNTTGQIWFFYDTPELTWYYETAAGYPTWPDPIDLSTSTNKQHSIYCTYTPEAPPVRRIFITHT